MRKRNTFLTIAVVVAAVTLVGCAHQTAWATGAKPGFFKGLLHGFLIFFSLVASIFTDVRIYAYPNTGIWYDVGYFLGASAFLGGSSTAGARRR